MKIIAKNNVVVATHRDDQEVEHLYPGCESLWVSDGYKKPAGGILMCGDNLVDSLDIDTAKALRRKLMDTYLDKARSEGITCSNGIKIQCGEIDLVRWLQAKTIIDDANLTEIVIRDYNNERHTVTASDFTVMRTEVGAYVQQLLNHCWDKKDSIDESHAVQDVMSINW